MKLLRSGYILMLTLMMVALMTALATYIVYQTADFAPTVRAQADKRKAWQLALSGVNIALAQLSVAPQQTQAAGKKAQ
ncbi:MAG TPA: hypothetical protein VLG71_02665, partial [Candidatus Limnocylindria bacterium]|nr:hypothetical protein [Candidatus Limnocylindria bacterium]